MGNSDPSRAIAWSQRLFFSNAAVWLCLGSLSLVRAFQNGGEWRWVYSGLMLGNALLMSWFGLKLRAGGANLYLLAIIYVFVNALLSIFNQVGWIDLLVLSLNLLLLGTLFIARHGLLLRASKAP